MGPCLCGDPYCPSCGNPGAAAWEELVCDVTERVEAQKPTGIPEAVHAVLELLAEDAAMADALEAWSKRREKQLRCDWGDVPAKDDANAEELHAWVKRLNRRR